MAYGYSQIYYNSGSADFDFRRHAGKMDNICQRIAGGSDNPPVGLVACQG